MRYMLIIKSNAKTEAGEMPDEAFGAAMGKYNQELIDAGVFVTAEGFQPSSKGARITLENDKMEVTRGPLGNPEGLGAGFWVINANSKEAAVEWARRCPLQVEGSTYADGYGQIEIRPFIEMPGSEEQLAFVADDAPAGGSNGNQSRRFIGMVKSDPRTEQGEMPPPEVFMAMGAAMEPLMRDGILVAADGLQPSSQGVRVSFADGTPPVVTDGPFAETKELIGGYAILRVGSLDEAIELTKQAVQVEALWRDQPIEFDVRQLYDASDFE